MADSRIGILIEAKENANATINNVKENLGGIDEAARGGVGGFTALAGAAGVAVVGIGEAINAVSGLVQGIFSLAEQAAQVDRVRGAFENLAAGAGQSGDQILAAMQKASGGMISNAELVQSANRAMLLGVADSGEELGKLLEVARVRGAAMGLSVSQAFGDLVTGLGRMSPLILDNLGIVTGGEKVFDDYAVSLGRTADSLSDAEKKQALLNKVISETQPLIDQAGKGAGEDLAAPFERMNAAIQNAKQALGELFGPAVAVVAEKLADAARGAAEQVNAIGQGIELGDTANQISVLTRRIADLNSAIAQGEADRGTPFFDPNQLLRDQLLLIDLTKQLQTQRDRLGALVAAHDGAAAAAERHSEALLGVNTAARGAAAGIDITREAARGSIPAMRDAALAAADLAVEFNNASTALGAARLTASLANAAASDEALDKIRRGREEAAKYTNASTEAGRASLSQALAVQEVNNAIEAHNKALTADTSTIDKAAEAFDNLKSKVAGVLSQSLNLDVGVKAEDLLPREDAINENARRLADIAINGLKNQDWLGAFKGQVPDLFQAITESSDPRAAAARLLKDFQDGLEPGLIDSEKVKERVRRMILGEQSMEALASQIASELNTEFGAAAPANINDLVGQALGTGAKGAGTQGGSQAGADAAQSFAQSFVSAASGVGAQIANSLKADSVIALIKDAAKAAGEQWGNMFLSVVGDNVPESLVSLLTDLVTPGVQAKLTQQASLTGAK